MPSRDSKDGDRDRVTGRYLLGNDAGRRPHSKDGAPRLVRYFRASDAEWTYMKELAAEHGQTVSSLIRECLLADMPTTRNE